MNSKKRLIVIWAVCVIVTALSLLLFTSIPSNAQTPRTTCSVEGSGEYSRGAVRFNQDGIRYVCANVRSNEWQPMGVAWVRVEPRGNDVFVLSGPSAPGECERTENRRYSQGATLNVSGEVARCATVFDAGYRPVGAAWIDVTLLLDDFFVARIH